MPEIITYCLHANQKLDLKKLNQALYASTKLLQTTSALHWGIKDSKDKVDSYLLLQITMPHYLTRSQNSSLLYTNVRLTLSAFPSYLPINLPLIVWHHIFVVAHKNLERKVHANASGLSGGVRFFCLLIVK